MPQVEKVPTATTNPFYGCAIFIILASIMGGMVTWVVYSGLRQSKEIDAFTEIGAQPLPPLEISTEAKAALEQKLSSFTQAALNDKQVTLTLTPAEVNGLIVLASEKDIADYQGMVNITGFNSNDQTVLADVCWPLNNLPFSDKTTKRYLVGKGAFSPTMETNGFDIKIHDIQVPGKTVSQGFLGSLQMWPWLNLAKLNTDVAETLKRVKTYGFSKDGTVFFLEANTAPPASGS